jgi:hypothetical protein
MSPPLRRPAPAAGEPPPRSLRTPVFLGSLLVSLVWFVNAYPHARETGSASRVYLALAIADDHSFRIDRSLALYGDNLDKARRGGHHYSDKPPGTAFLLAPFAWLLRRGGASELATLTFGLRIVGLSLPVVGFWWLVLPWFDTWSGSRARAIAVVAAGALGTNFAIYSTHLYGHVPAGVLLFLAFLAARCADPSRGPALALKRGALAGALAGLAFLNDFVVMFAVAVLALYALRAPERSLRRGLGFLLGLAPCLIAWMGYNWLCFGGPLQTGFQHLVGRVDEVFGPAYRTGFFGIQPPDPTAPLGMLFSPARGVLFLSPVLALAPVGFWRQIRYREQRGDALVGLAVALAVFAFAATTVDWRGGWGIGTRYLVPAIPFLLVGVAGSIRDRRAADADTLVFGGLALVGILLSSLAAATSPIFPQEFRNPLFTLAWPLARDDLLATHLGTRWPAPRLGWLPPAAALLAAAVLVLTSSPSRGPAHRLACGAASAAIAAALLAWQALLPAERPDEALARELAAAEALLRMDHLDEGLARLLALSEPAPGAPAPP